MSTRTRNGYGVNGYWSGVGIPDPSDTHVEPYSQDINTSFEKCQVRIAKLLQEHPGHLHFATDAWTSPNHHTFVTWTVHFEYEGGMLSFLLDILELPEVRLT